jgi:light-regulated signal transduction histidine kinase (bacteriophytochrome)
VASHDLQEPLRAVGGFMQRLDQQYGKQLDERAAGYIQKAVQGAARMQQLINDLLLFSSVTREVTTLKPVDLSKAVKQACTSLEETIRQRNAEVQYNSLPTINGELAQLTRLFQNLIDNGTKYCKSASPKVVIDYTEIEDHYLVNVTDNGIGIKPEYRAQIFAIFKRLHHREEYPGTGVGLAICQRVAERHGGSISIEAVEGGGTRFVLKFPKKQETNV